MQWVNYYQFTHPQEYWNACLKKAELELKQRHFLESENLRNRELGLAQERLSLDYQKFQTEQQNFHAQLAAQNEIAQVRAKTDLEVENIRSAREINLARERAEVDIGIEKFRAMHGMELAQQRAEADIGLENLRAVHAMDLAHFNADSAANLAKINGWNDILNGAIRGNAELSTTLANGRNNIDLAVTNNILSMVNQFTTALLNEVAEENKHERNKELLRLKAELDAKNEREFTQIKANLSVVKSFLDFELSKQSLEYSKQCEIIFRLVEHSLNLGEKEFSEDEIREAVNKMMRETEPYTGY